MCVEGLQYRPDGGVELSLGWGALYLCSKGDLVVMCGFVVLEDELLVYGGC